jgi:hypothetical protein
VYDPPRDSRVYEFPPNDLLATLIDLYFTQMDEYFSLLHRPTFEYEVASGLHLTNQGFASVLLAVCACGARISDDPRVVMKGTTAHSAGWRWFRQIQLIRRSFWVPPSLHDLQLYVVRTLSKVDRTNESAEVCRQLSIRYIWGSSAHQACYMLAGIGLREAVDIGLHQRKVWSTPPNIHDELWKRAFWCALLSVPRPGEKILRWFSGACSIVTGGYA